MNPPRRPALTSTGRGLLALCLSLFALVCCPYNAQSAKVVASNFASGTFEIGNAVSYSVTLEGTTPFDVANGNNQTEGPYAYILYVQGTDIYGNATFIEITRGQLTTLRGSLFSVNVTPNGTSTTIVDPPTRATIDGNWFVPNDGTLHRLGPGGYGFVLAVYPDANFPIDVAGFSSPMLAAGSTSPIFISVTPDLRINAPGATYRAGLYRGRDIIRFTTRWRNNLTMDNVRQSRPLRPINQDAYVVNLRLSTDPVYRKTTEANDDFNLMYGANGLRVAGDLAGLIADGTTEWRKVTVTSTPGKIPPYGILIDGSFPPAYIPETVRDYTPQPDDGFLDIGESVDLVTEHLIPDSYTGRYFVASDVTMSDAALDARPNNNTFVSNAANKIEVIQGTAATVEPVSAVMDQNANFIQGGDAASDFGSVSDGGNFIAFASRAQNLLVPSSVAGGATIPPQYATTGQQIFIRNRQIRETTLASRSAGGVQANADCYNPDISANGQFVAFESAASNLVGGASTGNKSMIYVYDMVAQRPVIVSRNRNGEIANGDCMNPSISESGRFVAFESIATNLDLPQFTATVSGGQITGFTKLRGGAGYNPAAPPAVTISAPQQAGGVRATATALVESGPNGYGGIKSVTFTSPGSGYTSAPTVTVAPPPPSFRQIYLHDRNVDSRVDADGKPIFDVTGNTATYLVSVNKRGVMAGQFCNMPVINIQDDATTIANNGGMFVAFVSYARTFPGDMPEGTGYAMVYRTKVNVSGSPVSRGPIPASVTAVSVNDANQAPTGGGFDPSGAYIVPYSWEPAISGDGSQVAFTSAGVNLVYNDDTGLFDGDTNLVPDVFVRNLDADLPSPATTRVSVSQDRVATGTIVFASLFPSAGNVPVNQPALGDFVELSDGITTKRFTFALTGSGDNVPIGPTVQATRNGLVAKINGAGMNLIAEATTPPDAPPGTAYNAAIYLKNTLPGKKGNVPITISSAVIAATGMAGGGTQAEDAPDAVQGVPFGSNQPSIDRSGRYVAFRSIAVNMDVHVSTDSNRFPESPITGEIIRPLISESSNVYLHDRRADGDESRAFDQGGNYFTTRVSVSKFGYPAVIFGSEPTGVDATTSANSSAPALSPDARFIAFSSDSSGAGGLIYGPNNLTPLDSNNVRDVLVYDRLTVGVNPVAPDTLPTVTISSPLDGLQVQLGTPVTVTAVAQPKDRKAIVSAECRVNGVSQGVVTATPFTWTFTADPAGTYTVEVLATDSRGGVGSSFVSISAEEPLVPTNPAPGSNQAFVVDYFRKVFLRDPSYPEYAIYLSQLSNGVSQAQVIVNMMQSPQFAQTQNVLFGYYLRMGLAPVSTNIVKDQLFTMSNATNTALLAGAFQPMDPASGAVPYGATVGQALVASELIGAIPYSWSNAAVQNLTDLQFVGWMQRSFNTPYLPSNISTNTIFTVGSSATVLFNVANIPSPGGATNQLVRFGQNYAYLSAFYNAAYAAGRIQNGLTNALKNFNPQVQGVAANYLLTTPNTWATNVPPLSTTMVQALLAGTPITTKAVAVGPQANDPQPQKKSQEISRHALPAKLAVGRTYTLAAASNSGLKVGYAVSNPRVARVVKLAGGREGLRILARGSFTLTASQAGNSSWAPAPQVRVSRRVR